MTMLNRLTSFADATIRAIGGETRRYAVHLVDTHSGRLHCVGGVPLTIFTCDPDERFAKNMTCGLSRTRFTKT